MLSRLKLQLTLVTLVVTLATACANDVGTSLGTVASAVSFCGPPLVVTGLTPQPTCEALAADGTTWAVFGYVNTGAPVTIPVGPLNMMNGGPAAQGQPIHFSTGTNDAAFAARMRTTTSEWLLAGGSATVAGTPWCATESTPDGEFAKTPLGGRILIRAIEDTVFAGSIVPTETITGNPNDQGPALVDLAGKFEVTADGAAHYTLPLRIPAGRNGLQPDLALSYDSNAGDSFMGVGWTVSGFSQITRCAKTIVSDGVARAVQFDDTDRFCLDGDYLVKVNVPASPNEFIAEYRPEHDPFTRVRVTGADSLGPTAFTVQRRNTGIATYGTGTGRIEGSRLNWTADWYNTSYPTHTNTNVRYAWLVSEARDRHGNGINFYYQSSPTAAVTHEVVPERIDYTTRPTDPSFAPTTRSVHFEYESTARTDKHETWISGFAVGALHLLRSITVSGPMPEAMAPVRQYRLKYRHDEGLHTVTHRSLLASVTECDTAGVCGQPLTFDWTDNDGYPFHDTNTGIRDVAETPSEHHWGLSIGDFNGDGRDDILYPYSLGVGGSCSPYFCYRLKWKLRLSNGTTFGAPIETTLPEILWPGTQALPMAVATDINGDGIADVAAPAYLPPSGGAANGTYIWRYYISAVSAGSHAFAQWNAPSTGPSADDIERAGCNVLGCLKNGGIYVGDADGDGRPDMFRSFYTGSAVYAPGSGAHGADLDKWVMRPVGDGGLATTFLDVGGPTTAPVFNIGGVFNTLVGDIDGSGRQSLLLELYLDTNASADSTRIHAITRASGGAMQMAPTTILAGSDDPAKFHNYVVDLNGDGVADFLQVPNGGGFPSLAINHANGTYGPVPAVPLAARVHEWRFGGFPGDAGIRFMDVDLDGNTDVLLVGQDLTGRASVGYDNSAMVYLSKWTDPDPDLYPYYTGLIHTGGRVPARHFNDRLLRLSQVLDIDGDGMSDLVQFEGAKETGSLHVYRRQGSKPDMVRVFRSGRSAEVRVTYDRHREGAQGGCTYPQSCVARGLWVVGEYSLDRANGTIRSYNLSYEGARYDLQGRGFLGFSRKTLTDPMLNQELTVEYDNTFHAGHYTFARLPKFIRRDTRLASGARREEEFIREYEESSGPVGTAPGERLVPFGVRVVREEGVTTDDGERVRDSERVFRDFDSFDNPMRVTTTGKVASITSEERIESMDYDEASWNLGMPHRVLIESRSSDGRNAARMFVFDNDLATAQVVASTIEGDATEYLRTEFDRAADGVLRSVTERDFYGATRTNSRLWDPDGVYPRKEINALGHVTEMTIHPSLGVPTSTKTPDGRTRHMRYDGFGRLRYVQSNDGSFENVSYKADGDLLMVETSGAGGEISRDYYDRIGRVRRRSVLGWGGQFSSVNFEFDDFHLGKVKRIRWPAFDGAPTAPEETFDYDEIGREIRHDVPGGAFTTTTYNRRVATREVHHDGFTDKQEIQVNEEGQVEHVKDFVRSASGSISEAQTNYAFGPFGVLDSVTGPTGASLSFQYDARGRRKETNHPTLGRIIFTLSGFGDLLREEYPATGHITEFEYDVGGRLTGIQRGDETSCFAYDGDRNALGKLSSSSNNHGVAQAYGYDGIGRLERSKKTIDGAAYESYFTYDSIGRLSSMQYPTYGVIGGPQIVYEYQPWGVDRVDRAATSTSPAHTIWHSDELDAQGRVVRESWGNGLHTQRTYDTASSWLKRVETKSGSTALQDLQYGYNQNGTLAYRDDMLIPATAPNGRREEFKYDSLNRLTSWSAAGKWGRSYAYDLAGNLKSITSSGTATGNTVFNPSSSNPFTLASVTTSSTAAVAYDDRGRQTSVAGARTVDYDEAGRPISITSGAEAAELTYDPDGVRAKKKDTGATTHYGSSLFERRFATPGFDERVYRVNVGGRTVAQITKPSSSSEEYYYLHDDVIGSVTGVSDGAAGLHRLRFDPFGARINETDPLVAGSPHSRVKLGFIGAEHDDSIGLISTPARPYDPKQGRFLGPDPVLGNEFDAQSMNPYAYALNSPTNLVDPSGLCPEGGCHGTGTGGSVWSSAGGSGGPAESLNLTALAGNCIGSECAALRARGYTAVATGTTRARIANWIGHDFNGPTASGPAAVPGVLDNLLDAGDLWLRVNGNQVATDLFNASLTVGSLAIGIGEAAIVVEEGLVIGRYVLLNLPRLGRAAASAAGAVGRLTGNLRIGMNRLVADERGAVRINFLAPSATGPGLRSVASARISPNDAARIQAVADKTRARVIVVGSRAKGTASAWSDWDYIIDGNADAKSYGVWKLPRGPAGGMLTSDARERGIDLHDGPLRVNEPHVIFRPNTP